MKQIVTITGENLNIVTNNVESATTGVKTKAQMRMEALRAAGVDVSSYYTLGADKIVKIENGEAVPVELDDVIVDAVGKRIVEGGYVNNWKLFRRWVTAQILVCSGIWQNTRCPLIRFFRRRGTNISGTCLKTSFTHRPRWRNMVIPTILLSVSYSLAS